MVTCWKISVQCGRELIFLHSDITVIILHGQILILYNWRPYLSITPRTMGRSAEFFRILGTASWLFRLLNVPVVYCAPDRQCIVLNAKPDADLFGSDHVTVCAAWPLPKLAEFDTRQMWISVYLTAIHRVLQWRYHFSGNNVTVINSPLLSWFRVLPTQEPILCQCDDHVLLSWTNHQPLGLVSSGRQLSPFLVTEQ